VRDADRVKRTIQVQRLVAWTFIGPQPKGMLVCHRNGNEHDNRVSNLYYGTPCDNAQDRERHKREAASCIELPAMRDDRGLVYKVDPRYGF
jgi:hypothetical protein